MTFIASSCVLVRVGCMAFKPFFTTNIATYHGDCGFSYKFIIDFIENDIRFLSKEFVPPSVKVIKNKRIISRGMLGYKNDIVVNDIENTKFIYGICDGLGGF